MTNSLAKPADPSPRTKMQMVVDVIGKTDFRDRLAAALPPNVDPSRFQRVVLTAIQQKPELVDANRESLYLAALKAASDGLLPDGREGAFVEYNVKVSRNPDKWEKRVQWMPMVAGVIKRLATAGINIDAQLVHEADDFDQILGDDAAIHHKAPKLGTSRGEILGVYAIARLPNGMVMREVMDLESIEQVRSVSKDPDGIWKKWYGEMARKSVIRRLAKRLPILDPKLADTIQRDDELYDFAAQNADAGDTPPKPEPASTGPRRPRGLDVAAAAASDDQVDARPGDIEGTATRVDRDDGAAEMQERGDEPSHF